MTKTINKKKPLFQYQVLRKSIPQFEKLSEFMKLIHKFNRKNQSLDHNQILGLRREFRAFHYLRKNPKFGDKYKISSMQDDLLGIDIISYKNDKLNSTFQVSGFNDDKSIADYIIKVDKDIWIFKNKDEE